MDEKNRLILPLQFFADDAEAKTTEENVGKVYTDEDLQREGDKRVSQALKGWEKTFETKLKEALKKTEMTDDDRRTKDLEEKEQALEAKEREINKRELKTKVSKDLSDVGLDTTWAESLVLLGDPKEIEYSIKKLKTSFDKAVEAKVADALRTGAPTNTETGKKSLGAVAAEQANTKTNTVDPWTR